MIPSSTASSVASPTSGLPWTAVKPILDPKRAASQPNYAVTLSITRDTTTYTTVVVLGGTEAPPSSPSSTVDSQQSPTMATGAATSSAVATPANLTSSNKLSSTTVAIIVRSVVGGVLFLVLLWICFYGATCRRLRRRPIRVSSVPGDAGDAQAAPNILPRPAEQLERQAGLRARRAKLRAPRAGRQALWKTEVEPRTRPGNG